MNIIHRINTSSNSTPHAHSGSLLYMQQGDLISLRRICQTIQVRIHRKGSNGQTKHHENVLQTNDFMPC